LEALYIYGNPKLTGTITQTFCSSQRGGKGFQKIQHMEVGCNVLCVEGCCLIEDDVEECPLWPTEQSDLPN
jgi:hypothetical protein